MANRNGVEAFDLDSRVVFHNPAGQSCASLDSFNYDDADTIAGVVNEKIRCSQWFLLGIVQLDQHLAIYGSALRESSYSYNSYIR